jgi:hypothetical protein
MAKSRQQIKNELFALLSPQRLAKQCLVDADNGCYFSTSSDSIAAYQMGACYTIQVIRQEMIAGGLIADDLAAQLDAIQYRLQ